MHCGVNARGYLNIAILDLSKVISRKRCKIGGKLRLNTLPVFWYFVGDSVDKKTNQTSNKLFVVQHDKLFVKLHAYGIGGVLLQWIINLFTCRTIQTRINDLLSCL